MLKKTVLGLTAGALLLSAGSALAADYKIDKQGQHAFIEFRIQHLGYSWLYGTFKDFDGGFTFDEKIRPRTRLASPSTPPASTPTTLSVTSTCAAQNS